ncbi:ETS-related transcription factor Elf-5-like isoform X2 [Venturia canescens]|uniref:ETS-related transcription factor Elf-5-like isoform X2 n=1 Tax=Venturia canescens TaxID=32260 RepID=UPI001C9CDA6D|nr:ETS-related transcription factor Elf-5-like isoform X2 [Venturia canescens]
MSAFVNYNRNDTLTNYLPMSTSQQSVDDGHFILDMDSIVRRDKEAPMMTTRRLYENTRKKCSLGDDEGELDDGNDWSSKPIKNWSQEDTINWLMSAALHMGQPYSSIQHSLAVPGQNLIGMSRQQFLMNDPIYGDRLYDMLHSQRRSSLHPHYATLNPRPIASEDESTHVSSNNFSESDNSVDVSTKRQPGRPRGMKSKKNSPSQGKLWEFIRDLLGNPETCPSLICWEDYSQAKFRFVRSDEVAKRWGSRKGNTKMTYEKLSRAMRYYYKSKIFQPVIGRRLVYQFGPNAKGWQTDNPNFRR